jgi:hypothetical protein
MAERPNIDTQYGVRVARATGKIREGFSVTLKVPYSVRLEALAIPPIMTGGIINRKQPIVENIERI